MVDRFCRICDADRIALERRTDGSATLVHYDNSLPTFEGHGQLCVLA
jgi:hypothetical protein